MAELTEIIGHLTEEALKKFSGYLLLLNVELKSRFFGFISLKDRTRILDPFQCNIQLVC